MELLHLDRFILKFIVTLDFFLYLPVEKGLNQLLQTKLVAGQFTSLKFYKLSPFLVRVT